MTLRFDLGSLGKAVPLPGGGYSIPARIARSGVQAYPDGRVYRDPADVVASAKTFVGAAVTIRHPDGGVNPTNWAALAKGVVLDVGEPVEHAGETWIPATLAVSSLDALEAVDLGEIGVSCGYNCDEIEAIGEHKGESYTRRQVNIRGNHVALIPIGKARAGNEARLLLDSKGQTMKIRFDSAEFETDDLAALQTALDAYAGKLTAAESALGEARGRADALAADVAKVPEIVASEIRFRADMLPILGADFDFSAGRKAAKLAALGKLVPSHGLTVDASDDLLDGYFAAVKARGVEQYAAPVKIDSNENDPVKIHREKTKGFQGY